MSRSGKIRPSEFAPNETHVSAYSLSLSLILSPLSARRSCNAPHKRVPERLAPFYLGRSESWAIILRPAAPISARDGNRARSSVAEGRFPSGVAPYQSPSSTCTSRAYAAAASRSPSPYRAEKSPSRGLFARRRPARTHAHAYARVVFNWVICPGTRRPPCARYSAFPCNAGETKRISEIARTERHRM